jgi:hypothetical protein
MKAVLIKKGYWPLVSGTETLTKSIKADVDKLAEFMQRQLEACSELILAVEDSQLAHMDGDDPKVIWDELTKVHGARGLSTQLAAIRKFVRMEKKADQSMSSWIGDVRSLAHQMKHVGITLPDIFTIVVLTSGLPSEYEPVVVALDAVDSTKLTLDITIARLLNEEERHLSRKLMAEYRTPTLNEPAADDDSAAYATPNVTCYACGKKGHYAKDCKKNGGDCKKTGGDAKAAVARDLDTGLDEPDGVW